MELSIKADIDNKSHVADTAGSVFQDYVGGMYDEMKNHSLKLVAEATISAGLTAGLAAAPLPALLKTGLAVAGAGVLVHDSVLGIKHLADQTSIINNYDGTKTAAEINAAHENISKMGAYAMNFGATAGGSIMGMETMRLAAGIGSPLPFSDGLGLRGAMYNAQIQTSAKELFEK